eukprot:Awhi_evm2s9658
MNKLTLLNLDGNAKLSLEAVSKIQSSEVPNLLQIDLRSIGITNGFITSFPSFSSLATINFQGVHGVEADAFNSKLLPALTNVNFGLGNAEYNLDCCKSAGVEELKEDGVQVTGSCVNVANHYIIDFEDEIVAPYFVQAGCLNEPTETSNAPTNVPTTDVATVPVPTASAAPATSAPATSAPVITVPVKPPVANVNIVYHCSTHDYAYQNIDNGYFYVTDSGELKRSANSCEEIATVVIASKLVKSIDVRAFADMDALAKIDLSDCAINDISDSTFSHLTTLRTLIVNDNNLQRVFSIPPAVETLSLDGNQIHTVPKDAYKLNHQGLKNANFGQFLNCCESEGVTDLMRNGVNVQGKCINADTALQLDLTQTQNMFIEAKCDCIDHEHYSSEDGLCHPICSGGSQPNCATSAKECIADSVPTHGGFYMCSTCNEKWNLAVSGICISTDTGDEGENSDNGETMQNSQRNRMLSALIAIVTVAVLGCMVYSVILFQKKRAIARRKNLLATGMCASSDALACDDGVSRIKITQSPSYSQSPRGSISSNQFNQYKQTNESMLVEDNPYFAEEGLANNPGEGPAMIVSSDNLLMYDDNEYINAEELDDDQYINMVEESHEPEEILFDRAGNEKENPELLNVDLGIEYNL